MIVLALAPLNQDEDIRKLAQKVADPATKLRLILMGPPAAEQLWIQSRMHDNRAIVAESRVALRWIMRLAKPEDIPKLAKLLEPVTTELAPQVRIPDRFALMLLGDLGGDPAMETLVGLLGDETLQKDALEALIQTSDRRASEILAERARKSSGEWGRSIILGLGQRRDPKATPALIEMTRSPATRTAALEALGLAEDPEGLETLFDALKTPERKIAIAAILRIAATKGLSPAASKILVRALDGVDEEPLQIKALEALAQVADPGSRKAIERVVQSGPRDVKAAAFAALLSIADWYVETDNIADARDLYWRVMQDVFDEPGLIRALHGCGRTQCKYAMERIRPLLNETRPALRAAAVRALGDLPGDESTKMLIAMLNTGVRAVVLETLARRRDAAAVPKIIPQAEKGEVEAIRALGEIGDSSAAEVLFEAMERKVEGALLSYVRLAEVIGESKPADARTILHKALDFKSTPAALRALARVGDSSSIARVEKTLADSQGEIREAAGACLIAIADRTAERAEAARLYRRAMATGSHELAVKLRSLGESVEIPARDGKIDFWWVIGPFQEIDTGRWFSPEFPERGIDLTKRHRIADKDVRWTPRCALDSDGVIEAFPADPMAAAYATCEVVMPQEGEVTLHCGHENGLIVWVNGEMVCSVLGSRLLSDEETIKVNLKEGSNRVLLKIRRRGKFRIGLEAPGEFKIK